MPLDSTNFIPNGPVKSADMRQFYDLATGVMQDQPVTYRNTLSVGGNQNVATVPLKVYGALGQTTNLIDLYSDRTASQPGFGFNALGALAWGPGGAAPQDTFASRIGTQNGHATDTPGVLITPNLEVTGSLVAGSLSVSSGGLGTIGATRIDFSPTAFIQAYPADNTFVEVPKLRVSPGITSVVNLTVGTTLAVAGAATLSSTLNVAGAATLSSTLNVASNTTVGGVLGVVGRGYVGNWDGGQAFNVGGNILASSYVYQRGSTSYRCWDNADFAAPAVGIVGSTPVLRDASGNIQAANVYMPSAAQGGSPAYIAGQNGDGYIRWYPKV